MSQAKRLIINTFVTHGRMVVTVGMGLLTTRLLLQALGEVDFGIFMVLGASLNLLMVLEFGLTNSTQRHLAYELGREDHNAAASVFSTMFVMYWGLALVIVLLGEAMAMPLLHGLKIPPDRMVATHWVYQIMLVNLALVILSTPYSAVFTARQAMVQDAGLAIFDSILALGIAISVIYIPGDTLIWYIGLLACRQGLLSVIRMVMAMRYYPESRFRRSLFQRTKLRGLMSFASLTLLSTMFWQINTQCSFIMLNLFFGPAVNAAFGVAAQAKGYHTSLTATIINATAPALTNLEGAGRRDKVRLLACTSGKLSALLGLYVAIPFTLEMGTFLKLWLKEIPAYTDVLVPLLVVAATIDLLTRGLFWTMRAIGCIGKEVRTEMWLSLLSLPVVWVLLKWGYGPVYLPLTWLAVAILGSLVRARVFGKCVGISVKMWFQKTVWPVLKVSVGLLVVVYPAHWFMTPGIPRLLTVMALLVVAAPALIWIWGLDDLERSYFQRFIQPMLAKRKLSLPETTQTEPVTIENR